MRVIKLAIISVVVLFLVVTAFSLLLPSNVIVSRAIDINAALPAVFPLVNNVGKWSVWMQNFDTATVTVSPNTVGRGATFTTNQLVIKIVESSPQKISAIWQSGENRPLPGEFNFFTSDSSSTITVQWQFTQKVKWYPWEKFASIVSDKALGPYMEQSLDNLKKYAEEQ
jgi:hypothetical protein